MSGLVPTGRRYGFTLVELLVVISIIALLASFILPGLSRAREYAYFSRCKSNLRQIGIGFLIYTGDNKGRLPEGVGRCDGSSNSGLGYRRTGGYVRVAYTGAFQSPVGGWLRRIYDDTYPGKTWTGSNSNVYLGKPRLRGRYLPIDIFWDPIVIVRDWNMRIFDVGHRAGTEKGRDENSRRKGNFGYALFIYSIGCAIDKSSHTCPADGGTGNWNGSEEHFRWAAKGADALHTGFKPSVWLAACTPAHIKDSWKSNSYEHISHFGARSAKLGTFRFNVIHMDGHVDDSQWKSWWQSGNWDNMWQTGCWGFPYGYEQTSGPYGCEKEPEFEGAFDDNL
jgi:prepilin-type N-terminal cleavage/methylation domain-containing protein